MTLLINHLTRVIAPHGGISQIFIRNRWKKFLGECVEMQHGFPKLFYLRMDIRNAFPSVNTTKLLEILTEVVDLNKKYVVQEVCIGNPIRKVRDFNLYNFKRGYASYFILLSGSVCYVLPEKVTTCGNNHLRIVISHEEPG